MKGIIHRYSAFAKELYQCSKGVVEGIGLLFLILLVVTSVVYQREGILGSLPLDRLITSPLYYGYYVVFAVYGLGLIISAIVGLRRIICNEDKTDDSIVIRILKWFMSN